MKFYLMFFLCIFSFQIHAFENSFLAPIGAYEAITGNTGIGRDGSVGAVLYNPSGLASVKSSKLSASGSAFALNSVSINSGSSNETVQSFQTIPAQITSVFAKEKFVWAFSVLVPKRVSYESRAKITDTSTAALTGSYIYTEEDQETYFGPSIGFAVSNELQIGFSLFVDKLDYKYASEQIMKEDGTSNYSLQTDRRNITALTAIPILGILYRPSNSFSIGARFSGPNKKLSGSFEHLIKTIDNTTVAQPNGEQSKKFSYSYEKPMELGVGISSKPTKDLTILLDVSNQFQKTYTSTKTDLFGVEEEYKFKNTQRYNLGVEYQTSHTDDLTFGINYNPDPFKDGNLNFTGITLGYRTLEKIADSSFGFFYNQANSKDESQIKTKVQIFGLFLSTSIDFKL